MQNVAGAGARERAPREGVGNGRASLDEARRSVTDLRGTATAGKPLAAAIGALVRELTAESGIPVTFLGGEHSLDAAKEGELFRIAQQALANARQHAHAKDIGVLLTATSGTSP